MSNYEKGKFRTPFGFITLSNPGPKTTPRNVQTLKRRKGKPAVNGCVYTKDAGDVVLQGPALRAFRQAEFDATPKRLRRKGKVIPIILTGVGGRTYASQAALYYGPTNTNGTRFANPDGSMHVEFLAVDINTGFLRLIAGIRARKALIKLGWFFAVPGEIWHASFHKKG